MHASRTAELPDGRAQEKAARQMGPEGGSVWQADVSARGWSCSRPRTAMIQMSHTGRAMKRANVTALVAGGAMPVPDSGSRALQGMSTSATREQILHPGHLRLGSTSVWTH